MNRFLFPSIIALLFLTFVLSIVLYVKGQGHHVVKQPVVESKYQTLPKASPTVMMHENGHMMNMDEKLKSDVSFGEDAVTITNGDTVEWTNCTLEMNQTVVRRGYIFTQTVFPSQKKITIPYTSFIREGVAFNPEVSHPDDLMLMCESQGNMTGWNYFTNR